MKMVIRTPHPVMLIGGACWLCGFVLWVAFSALTAPGAPPIDLTWHQGDTDPIRIETPAARSDYQALVSNQRICTTMVTASTATSGTLVLTPCVGAGR